jgi:hypothetical protein
MRWGIGINDTPTAAAVDALRKEKDAQLERTEGLEAWDDRVEAQMVAAIEAAEQLVALVGEDQVSVSVNGNIAEDEDDVDHVAVSVYGFVSPEEET